MVEDFEFVIYGIYNTIDLICFDGRNKCTGMIPIFTGGYHSHVPLNVMRTVLSIIIATHTLIIYHQTYHFHHITSNIQLKGKKVGGDPQQQTKKI